MSPLVIRADASQTMGTGHVMRMIALAQAYQKLGGTAIIASATCPDTIITHIRRSGIKHAFISDEQPGGLSDATNTVALCEKIQAKWIVLDGYHFDCSYQDTLTHLGHQVLAVDDYGHCDIWNCHTVLNQNLGAEKRSVKTSNRTNTRWLLGSNYALIRTEFQKSISSAKEKTSPIKKLIISLGGSDPNNVTQSVLIALNKIPRKDLTLRIILGGANPHIEKLQLQAKHSIHPIELFVNVDDMPAVYDWADAIISAGGSTCWEWLAHGLPGAVVNIADNQTPIISELIQRNLALNLGRHTNSNVATWPKLLEAWLNHKLIFSNFIDRRNIIDGFGADRVAASLTENDLWCRPANFSDAEIFFKWANDPYVRTNGFHPNEISWEEHCRWFHKQIEDPQNHLYIFSNSSDQKIGQVRFTQENSESVEIGFSVNKNFRGKGLGKPMLLHSLESYSKEISKQHSFIARVKPENIASTKIFLSLGFTRIEDDKNLKCLVYKIASSSFL